MTDAPDGRDPLVRALDRVLAVFLLGAGFSIVVEQSTAILAGLIWIVGLARRREVPYLPLLSPSIAFLAASLVSSVAALRPGVAFGQLRSEWVPFLLMLVVANLPADARSARRRVRTMTVVAALMVAAGLIQTVRFGPGFRIFGTLGHYMTYSGVLLLLALPMLASLLFRANGADGRRRAFTGHEVARGIVLVGMGVALILTQTRGAWLAAMAGAAVLVAIRRARWLAVLPVLAVVAFLLAPPQARARIQSLADLRDVTATERVYMWRASADMLRDHPLTGVGPDNFAEAIGDYRVPGDPWLLERPLKHAHSNPFMLAAERGWLGLGTWAVFWLAWSILTIRTLLRTQAASDRAVVAGSLAAVVAFHVAGLTEYTWGDTEVVYLAAFVAGTGLGYSRGATLAPS